MKKSEKTASLSVHGDFLSCKHVAVAGVSCDPRKSVNVIFREMLLKGYNVFQTNPKAAEIEGRTCYPAIKELPGFVEAPIIIIPPQQTMLLLKFAAAKGISRIWIQPGAGDSDLLSFCRKNQLQCVTRNSILLYFEPVTGIHKLHRFFNRLFGFCPN